MHCIKKNLNQSTIDMTSSVVGALLLRVQTPKQILSLAAALFTTQAFADLGPCVNLKNGAAVRIRVLGQPLPQSAMILGVGDGRVTLRVMGNSLAAGQKVSVACSMQEALSPKSPRVETADIPETPASRSEAVSASTFSSARIPEKYSATPGNSSCKFYDGYVVNGDGTITDPRSGLVFRRCAEGLKWDGTGCMGDVRRHEWLKLMRMLKQGDGIWRLPTRGELAGIVGDLNSCRTNKDVGAAMSARFNTGVKIQRKEPLDGVFWTATSSDDLHAYFIDGGNGYSSMMSKEYSALVLLVKSNPPSGGDAEFRREAGLLDKYEAAATKDFLDKPDTYADDLQKNIDDLTKLRPEDFQKK